jgi:hypothetical protein
VAALERAMTPQVMLSIRAGGRPLGDPSLENYSSSFASQKALPHGHAFNPAGKDRSRILGTKMPQIASWVIEARSFSAVPPLWLSAGWLPTGTLLPHRRSVGLYRRYALTGPMVVVPYYRVDRRSVDQWISPGMTASLIWNLAWRYCTQQARAQTPKRLALHAGSHWYAQP